MEILTLQALWLLAVFLSGTSVCAKRHSCGDEAYVTYTSSDMSAQGALVVRTALKKMRTTRCIVVMVTKGVSPMIRSVLERRFDQVVDVNPSPEDLHKLGGDKYADEGVPRQDPVRLLGKLGVWTLTQFKKVVFLESDTLVLRNPETLFEFGEVTAAPEATWPDWFNSAVMVLSPDLVTHSRLLEVARTGSLLSGTEQGVLNTAFPVWQRLPYVYNVPSTLPDTNRAAFLSFKDKVVVVRFEEHKPWFLAFNPDSQLPEVRLDMVGWMSLPLPFYDTWWRLYAKSVLPDVEKSLQEYNMSIIRQGPRIILGNGETGLRVEAGFYIRDNKSYPKMLKVRGQSTSNEFCHPTELLRSPKIHVGVQG